MLFSSHAIPSDRKTSKMFAQENLKFAYPFFTEEPCASRNLSYFLILVLPFNLLLFFLSCLKNTGPGLRLLGQKGMNAHPHLSSLGMMGLCSPEPLRARTEGCVCSPRSERFRNEGLVFTRICVCVLRMKSPCSRRSERVSKGLRSPGPVCARTRKGSHPNLHVLGMKGLSSPRSKHVRSIGPVLN